MKGKHIILIVLAVIVADQVSKIWIKTHYPFGHVTNVMGSWFKLYFVENEGMAWGYKWGGNWGKLLLTLFRLVAVIIGTFYLNRIFLKKQWSNAVIICSALIYAGALGNLIDSMFYGLIFEETTHTHIAGALTGKGYAGFLYGHVVDMLYFPIIDTYLPSWVPFLGGQRFTFFDPVFNIADASISVGVITLLVFQKKLFPKTPASLPATDEQKTAETTSQSTS